MGYQTVFAKDSTLPQTKFKVVRDVGKTKNAAKFFKYWYDVPDAKKDLVVVKLYRLWPICDLKALDPNSTVEWHTFNGAIPFPYEEYETAFMHKFGSGEWRAVLGEAGVTGVVMEAYFAAIDMDNYPPILDLRTLLRGNFKNSEYVKYLERRNIPLPWNQEERNKEKEDEEMNTAEALGTLAQTTVEMAGRLSQQGQPRTPETVDAEAVSGVVKMMADGQKVVLETMKQQVDQVTAAKNPDPIESMTKAVELADRLRGNTDLGPTLLAMQKSQMEFMERMLTQKKAEEQATMQSLTPTVKPGIEGLLDEVEKFKRLQDLFGWNGNGRRNTEPITPAPPSRTWVDALGEMFVANPTGFLGAASTTAALLTNLVLAFMGKGKPPDEAAGMVQTPNGPQPGPQTPQASAAPPTPWPAQFVMDITEPFYAQLTSENANGYTLAEYVLSDGYGGGPTAKGRRLYDMVKEQLGPKTAQDGQVSCALHELISRHNPLWDRIKDPSDHTKPAAPQKYFGFLNEFFTYDEAREGPGDEDEKNAKVATNATTNAPVA